MSNIIYRHATIDDMILLLPLMKLLEYPVDEQTLKQRFQKFIKNKGYGIIVAIHQNSIVGFIAWSKSMLFVSESSRFHIEAIIVDPEFRGLAIGKKLISLLEDIAKKNSPAIIDLTSGLRRKKDGSHKFYERLGFHNEGHMAKLYLRKIL